MGRRRGWGLATQLYSVRSRQSWGVGDLADLEDLAVWSASEHGADYVLVNPLHAAEPVPPMEPSPYLPTSRRFANPLYLRVERIPEYAWVTRKQRAKINEIRVKLKVKLAPYDQIDRDRSWKAKRKALKIIFSVPLTPGRAASFAGVPPPRRDRAAELRDLGGARRGARAALRRLAGGPAGPGLGRGPGLRRPATRPRSTSSAGCSGCWTSNWRPRSRPACGPAWRSASCTTSRSG